MEVRDFIAETVASGEVRGSELANLVYERFPNWRPEHENARNLRAYIDANVEGVSIVGSSGMDVVYGIAGALNMTSTGSRTHTEPQMNLWRVWVSPNSPYALSIDEEDGSVNLVGRHSPDTRGHMIVEPADTSIHEAVAWKFVEKMKEDGLTIAPPGGNSGWWFEWFKEIQSLGLDDQWRSHRTFALNKELEDALVEVGLSDPARLAAIELINRDRIVGNRKTKMRDDIESSTVSDRTDSRSYMEDVIRQSIVLMATEDLREIKIPLGIVMDVLNNRRHS